MSRDFSKCIGETRIEVETNDSGLNEPRIKLTRLVDTRAVNMRFTEEELRDLHYMTGRAIASIESETQK